MSPVHGAARERLRGRFRELGFDSVRFASAAAVPANNLRAWLAAGNHADMAWLERGAEKRLSPELVLPGVRTVALLGVNYWSDDARFARGGAWARYALHRDYHDTIQPALVAAGKLLETEWGAAPADYRYYVDTGPVLERAWSAAAGLGFTGKNAMLISREHGNWLFLAAILLRLEVEPDAPLAPERTGEARREVGLLCGKCTRCSDACPTAAITAPGVVDARRCISYHTIENRGFVPRELRGRFGARVYGCDVCLEVCPWNRFAEAGRAALLERRYDVAELRLLELLRLTPERFRDFFRGTAIKRTKLTGLLRNACIAAGNVWRAAPPAAPAAAAPAGFAPAEDRAAALAELRRLLRHESPVVRGHAVWALREILGAADSAHDADLAAARAAETDAAVSAEFDT